MDGFVLAAGGMVFALTLAVVIGRWVMAEETWAGVLVRTGLLLGIYAFGLSQAAGARSFLTPGFLAAAALAPLPLVDALWRKRLTARWLRQRQRERSSQAVLDMATDPASPMARLRLGRALLEEHHLDPGLQALEAAVELAPEDSKRMLRLMAEEAREEFTRECPTCREANVATALACRRCLGPLTTSLALRVVIRCCRPALRRERQGPGERQK